MGIKDVNYVNFGGVLIPEDSRHVMINQGNKTMYCVFLNDDGAKVIYPKQTEKQSPGAEYIGIFGNYDSDKDNYITVKTKVSKNIFDDVWENSKNNKQKGWDKVEVKNTPTRKVSRISGRRTEEYQEVPVSGKPKIEYNESNKYLFTTTKIDVSNIDDATITGSSHIDSIVLHNGSNCKIEVDDYNNSIIFHDSVTVINGENNTIHSGEHDKTAFQTYDYNTKEVTSQTEYTGRGKYIQN